MAEYTPSGKLVKDENLLQFAEGLKTAFYSKDEVDSLVSQIPKFGIQVVESLPVDNISESTVYLVKSGDEDKNLYTEYIYVNSQWETLGEQSVDLSDYATKEEVNAVSSKVDTVDGKIPTNVSELTNDANYITAEANVASATKLETARNINGVAFDGTQDITIEDNTKLPLAGGNVTGPIVSTSTITATQFTGDLEGNASSATKATQDGDGNVITETYATKSEVEAAKGEVEADDVKYDNEEYPTVAAALDKLLYVDVTISSFTSSVTQAENGATVNDVTLTWKLGGKPTSVTLDNEAQDTATSGQKILSDLGLKANKTWTLKASDAQTSASKTVTLSFLNSIYYGKSSVTSDDDITSAMILGLTSKLASNYKGTFTVNAGDGEYIYFAFPASFGSSPSFSVGGFEGGFSLVKTFDHTNASGASVSYNVFRSTQPNLGNTSVVIA